LADFKEAGQTVTLISPKHFGLASIQPEQVCDSGKNQGKSGGSGLGILANLKPTNRSQGNRCVNEFETNKRIPGAHPVRLFVDHSLTERRLETH
jgi:hypothetical protein